MEWKELYNKRVTPHFWMYEVIPPEKPSDVLLPEEYIYANFSHLFGLLEEYRQRYRTPFIITSGLRTPSTNWSSWSYHMFAMAVDFYPEDESVLDDLLEDLYHNWLGGCGWYPDQQFIHVDIGYKRRWMRVNGVYRPWRWESELS